MDDKQTIDRRVMDDGGDDPCDECGILEVLEQVNTLTAERDRLTAQIAQMREALETRERLDHMMAQCPDCGEANHADFCTYRYGDGCEDEEEHVRALARAALSTEPVDYHNPADTARIAELEKAIRVNFSCRECPNFNHCETPCPMGAFAQGTAADPF